MNKDSTPNGPQTLNDLSVEKTSSSSLNIDCIIDDLPIQLKKSVMLFNSDEEQKVALYTMMVISGTLFPNAWINYKNKVNYLQLMLFVIGPPSSGKGALSDLKRVTKKINQHLRSEYDSEYRVYKQQKRESEATSRDEMSTKELVKPKLKLVDSPGNITSSKLMEQLSDNGNLPTLIVEAEIDAFGLTSKSTHGNLNSTIIRNAFHHEQIALRRKMNDEYINVTTPKLACALSGTFGQLKNMISSNEDGTYSRFLIQRLIGSLTWSDVRPAAGYKTIDDHIDDLAGGFLDIFNNWRDKDVEVKFQEHHWLQTNDFGSKNLVDSYHLGEHASSLVKRHGLMLMRMAATLTMLRNCEVLTESTLYCSDTDFNIALSLANYSLDQSFELFQKLPGEKQHKDGDEKAFLSLLPEHFNVSIALECAKTLPHPPAKRTVERWLQRLVASGQILRDHLNHYKKQDVAVVAVAVGKDYYAPPVSFPTDLSNATATTATINFQN